MREDMATNFRKAGVVEEEIPLHKEDPNDEIPIGKSPIAFHVPSHTKTCEKWYKPGKEKKRINHLVTNFWKDGFVEEEILLHK